MRDIIIYTMPKKLLHKRGLLENDTDHSSSGEYVWSLGGRLPKDLRIKDRIYFATEGFIRGYFIVEEIDYVNNQIIFNCDTWKPLETLIAQKPLQGFKYYKREQ